MTIREAFVQFKSEFHLGNICQAIGNFFQNVKGSLGSKETSDAMGSAPAYNDAPVAREAHPVKLLKNEDELVYAFESPERESWFDAHNREVEDLRGRAGPEMKTFFNGPTPTAAQKQDLENMTSEEAKEFLGIRDGEETHLSASTRGGILEIEANKIFVNIRNPSIDQENKIEHVRRKIQKAVELVESSDFRFIPEPKVDAY
ncbi:MAG: hypothetical protein LBR92_00110 [Puniceicoccales bacterium]|jgi:hypothetical protein|nr:hypothetical protein [Puniceicoccales bacterium]